MADGGAPAVAPPRRAVPSPTAVTVQAAVSRLSATLAAAGVREARHEARDILAALLDVPRFWPTANRDVELDGELWELAFRAAEARALGAPFAYAVRRAAFRHLTLEVDECVLIPRQETEQLVELVLRAATGGGVAIDVGTGSGAIALALATEGQFASVIGTDISLDALAVAGRNAARLAPALRAPVELRHGALLAPVRGLRARVVVSNPPYIGYAEAAELPSSVRDWEPPVALYSGESGMVVTAAVVRGAAEVLEPGGLLALEVDVRRAALVAELARSDGRYRDVQVRLDLSGRERFVLATRRG